MSRLLHLFLQSLLCNVRMAIGVDVFDEVAPRLFLRLVVLLFCALLIAGQTPVRVVKVDGRFFATDGADVGDEVDRVGVSFWQCDVQYRSLLRFE